jgi:hypothetical protein
MLQLVAAAWTARTDPSKESLELRDARLGNSKLKFLTLHSKLEDSADEKPTRPCAEAASGFSSKSANCDGLSPT